MSELINTRDSRATIRWKLLTSASALALTAYVSSAAIAKAEDATRQPIWIELGGQMESIGGQGQPFAPDFLAANPTSPVLGSTTPIQAQKPPKFTFGEEGKISFQPEGSDWVFSAAIRYGRSGNFRHVQHQTRPATGRGDIHHSVQNHFNFRANFADTKAQNSEANTILDFTAGKDVGLGIAGDSTLNLGVRIAQFQSNASVDMRARPNLYAKYYPTVGPTRYLLTKFNAYHATGQAKRSFRGVGPSLSWNGSAPFVGNVQDGELTLDWGANAALLFGKQKAHTEHKETGYYHRPFARFYGPQYDLVYQNPVRGHTTDRSITVPNVGGSVGLSWRAQDFKVSLGYRADFFFGAMDTGIDAAKKSNATFNGPYASISVGLGD